MANNLLTIIVPTQATPERLPYLKACIRTLSYFTPQFHILVVKNGSQQEKCDLNYPNVVTYTTPRQGQCHAVNFALQYVTTPFVMVTNDDMLYGPGWQISLSKAVDEYQVVCPNLIEPHGGAHPFMEICEWGDKMDESFNAKAWFEFAKQFHGLFQYNYDGKYVEDGFNLPFLTKTEILKSIGGYDEAYDPYGANSDSDLEYAFMIAGIRPTRVKASVVWHFSLQSSDATKDEERRIDWFKNKDHFIHKWGFERQMDDGIWYAAGKNGIRIPTKERPYIFEHAAGHGEHPGQDWLEFHPSWEGKFGAPVYGDGKYYGN